MAIIEQAFVAQGIHQGKLLEKSNVVGVAVGFKNRQGETTGEPSVVVLVEKKKSKAELTADDLIPSELEGMRTDVIEIGVLKAQLGPRDQHRPVIPAGVSMGHFGLGNGLGAGTLGAVVRDRSTGEKLLLSNNHVFANSNDANVNDDILQPGTLDGGNRRSDIVAQLVRWQQLAYVEDGLPQQQPTPTTPPTTQPEPTPQQPTSPTQPSEDSGCDIVDAVVALANVLASATGSSKRVQASSVASMGAQSAGGAASAQSAPVVNASAQTISATSLDNQLDAAVARPNDPAMFSDEIRSIGRVTGTKPAALGMRLAKSGRTTDYTEGNVILLNATVNVEYETRAGKRTGRFVGQIICQGMSDSGDSGSLMVDPTDRMAVGLLFAGSPAATVCTPINRVLDALNVRF